MRGEIYAVAGRGDFANKPRPGLVVQSDLFNPAHPSVTVCPVSSTLTSERLYRIPVIHDAVNGLKWDSEIEVDKVQSVWIARVGQRIGVVSESVMAEVDEALRRWLDL
jgi:mRNA interferase MazF